MNDIEGFLLTWTTYGTWLPGDIRGWRNRHNGHQLARPLLEQWCRKQMTGEAVLLVPHDRETVELACREHCKFRGWELKAVNARTNHVHVVVLTNEKPQKVRDQLKANCTRLLRLQKKPLVCKRTWSRGGDCEVLSNNADIEDAMLYVIEGQDQKSDYPPTSEPNALASGLS